jgi:hypothetical protein
MRDQTSGGTHQFLTYAGRKEANIMKNREAIVDTK